MGSVLLPRPHHMPVSDAKEVQEEGLLLEHQPLLLRGSTSPLSCLFTVGGGLKGSSLCIGTELESQLVYI